MNEILQEAFRYSAWATKQLIAVCRDLPVEQLNRPARGFGSLLATLNHVVVSDAHYVAIFTGVGPAWATGGRETDDLEQLEARVEEVARSWEQLLAEPVDAERLILLDEGTYECHASVVVAQALHHANAHREQVRAGLKDLGVKPPDVQPWEYALATGRARWVPRRD
ncbi:MAG: DinB family protein [Planctomycetota bacterium]|jgi:uncharacterized damage-inducible protein DinB